MTFTDRQNPTLSRIMDEAYCQWITRFCQDRGIPCQPEWLEPVVGPYPDAPAMGPIARARQDRALAKMRGSK